MVNVWTSRLVHGGGSALLLALLGWVGIQAQPPGRGEVQTVRGKVTSLTTAPKGEVDGAVLEDGTVVHWPPHLEERFKLIVKKDDRIEATGRMETGKRGDTHLEVLKVTNLRTKVSGENDDVPPPPKGKGKGKDKGAPPPPPDSGPAKTVQGTVKEFTTAPKGEVDGLRLNDGTWVHWPPHLQDRFKDIAAKGDRVEAVGYMETGPRGDDPHLEVSTLTNLRSGATRTNPDRPAAVPDRTITGKTTTRTLEDRVQSLEDKIDQLTRAIERLQNKK
jgi:hypothetical protein